MGEEVVCFYKYLSVSIVDQAGYPPTPLPSRRAPLRDLLSCRHLRFVKVEVGHVALWLLTVYDKSLKASGIALAFPNRVHHIDLPVLRRKLQDFRS